MDKLNMQSKDITRDNIDKIERLFPNIIKEIKDKAGRITKAVDFELLQQELSNEIVEGDKERYQLTWPGKKEAILQGNTPVNKTLRPVKEDSVDWDNTENLYIEGDNLEVLKLLQESYLNNVKIIYIDPPYNTGRDFVYRDNFTQDKDEYLEESGQIDGEGNRLFQNTDSNGRYHSDWLSMMYPRLKLAKNLLAEDGVIFISIDDNEVHNLRKICDEIFGDRNFVGTLSVENNPKGRKNSEFISVSSEYLIIFAKDIQKSYFVENIPKKASDMKEDENGNFVHNSGKRVLVGENSFNKPVTNTSSDKNYSVYYRKKDKSLHLIKEKFGDVNQKFLSEAYVKYCSHNNGVLVENTYTEGKFRELFTKGALEFSQEKIYEKNYSDTIRIKSQLVNREYEAIVRGKKMKYSTELTTTGAGTYLKNLFQMNELPFSAPKNVGYLRLLISLFENEPFIILDFFSGSATTADAVMQLNAEDRGNRKYIMVQLPEETDEKSEAYKAGYKNICEIGKERIRRAAKKIKEETNTDIDYGFRVFKVDSTNMKDVYYYPNQYSQMKLEELKENIKEERIGLDLLTQVILELGLPLSLPIETKNINKKEVYFVDENALVACFDKNVDEEIIREIANEKPLKAVFRDSSFEDCPTRINLEEIFKGISPNTEIKVL